MNKLVSERRILAILLLVIVGLLGVYLETRPRLAPGQALLTDVRNIETLRAQFNQDVGKTRLIILVSPT